MVVRQGGIVDCGSLRPPSLPPSPSLRPTGGLSALSPFGASSTPSFGGLEEVEALFLIDHIRTVLTNGPFINVGYEIT